MTRLDLLKALLAQPDPQIKAPRPRYTGCTSKVQMIRPLRIAVRQFLMREAA